MYPAASPSIPQQGFLWVSFFVFVRLGIPAVPDKVSRGRMSIPLKLDWSC